MQILTKWKIEKYRDGILYQVIEFEKNQIVASGMEGLFQILLTGDFPINENTTKIKVGDSYTPTLWTMTDLQGTNTLAKDTLKTLWYVYDDNKGFISFMTIFDQNEANFYWWEIGLFRDIDNRMFNRRVYPMGRKTQDDIFHAYCTFVFVAEEDVSIFPP